MHFCAWVYADTYRANKLYSPSVHRNKELFMTIQEICIYNTGLVHSPCSLFLRTVNREHLEQGNTEVISPLCSLATIVSFANLLSLTFTIPLTQQELDSSPKLPSFLRNYCYRFLTILGMLVQRHSNRRGKIQH